MKNYKLGTATNGEVMHYSVGALVERDGKYLLLDRVNPPFGFAGPAGHVDEGETDDIEAMKREVEEETGLAVISFELVAQEELPWNWCNSGCQVHHWKLYRVQVQGAVVAEKEEAKSIGWYTKEELETMELEPVWRYWFEKLGILAKKKRITICGSTKFYDEMDALKIALEQKGYLAESVEKFMEKQNDITIFDDSNHEIWEVKKKAILAHFAKILWADAILVINKEKNNVSGYIGGNVLMEMGFALAHNKKIFLLNPPPTGVSYQEEILGCQPIVLDGDITRIEKFI